MDQNTNPEARNGDRKYRVRPGFVLREIAGEAAIIPVDGRGAFGNAIMAPNQTAAFLWKVFEQPRTIEEVVAAALEQFDAPCDTIRPAVEKFVMESLNLKTFEEVV